MAAAGMATRKQRKAMTKELENVASNVLQGYPDKNQRKILAARILSLKETIESFAARRDNDGEEKKKLSAVNKEYFSCLNEGDPSSFLPKASQIVLKSGEGGEFFKMLAVKS